MMNYSNITSQLFTNDRVCIFILIYTFKYVTNIITLITFKQELNN